MVLPMLLKGFGTYLSERTSFGMFWRKVQIPSANDLRVKSILRYLEKSVLILFGCVQKLVQFSFDWVSQWKD